MRNTLLVSTPETLARISYDPPSVRRESRRVRLALEELAPEDRECWEARLNRALSEEGGTTGVVGVVLAGLAYVGYSASKAAGVAATPAPALLGPWDQVLIGFVLVLGGAALGKVVGMAWANRSLGRSADRLAASLPSSRPSVQQ